MPELKPCRCDVFMNKLEQELAMRYAECDDSNAPSCSILLAVLNAVAEANKERNSRA